MNQPAVIDEQGEAWKPPYLSYTTFSNFIDKKCGEGSIPARIDKSFIDNVAGGVQPQLLAALRTVGLIDHDSNVRPLLHEAAQSPNDRQRILGEWASNFYSAQQELAANDATAQQLWESIEDASGFTGSTLRKSIVFYLALVEDTGLTTNAHFKPPKQSKVARKPKTRGRVASPEPETVQLQESPTTGSGETKTVDLGAAGTVTVIVEVKWLSLSTETMIALRTALDAFDELAVAEGRPADESYDDDDRILEL